MSCFHFSPHLFFYHSLYCTCLTPFPLSPLFPLLPLLPHFRLSFLMYIHYKKTSTFAFSLTTPQNSYNRFLVGHSPWLPTQSSPTASSTSHILRQSVNPIWYSSLFTIITFSWCSADQLPFFLQVSCCWSKTAWRRRWVRGWGLPYWTPQTTPQPSTPPPLSGSLEGINTPRPSTGGPCNSSQRYAHMIMPLPLHQKEDTFRF